MTLPADVLAIEIAYTPSIGADSGACATVGAVLANVEQRLADGAPAEAEFLLRQIIDALPNLVDVKQMLATLYCDAGHHQHALPLIDEILEAEPEHYRDVYAPGGHGRQLEATLAGQMAYEYSPISLEALHADVRMHDLTEGVLDLGSVRVG